MRETTSYTPRKCPFCQAQSQQTLTTIKAQEIADNNWSYRKNFASLLKISSTANFDIVKCSKCDFIYSKELPSVFFLNTLYDQVIDIKTKKAGYHYKDDYPRRLRYLSVLSHLINDNSLEVNALDYGAGFGQTSKLMQAQGMRVTAYETSTLRRKELSRCGIETVSKEAEIIENGPYSVIICDNVLEHVPDPGSVLSFFNSISDSGTILFISVPSYEKKEAERNIATLDMSLNPWEHLNYFDKGHLDIMLQRHDYELIPVSELGSEINIGLRGEQRSLARVKNGLATLLRLLNYIRSGSSNDSVNSRFYRKK